MSNFTDYEKGLESKGEAERVREEATKKPTPTATPAPTPRALDNGSKEYEPAIIQAFNNKIKRIGYDGRIIYFVHEGVQSTERKKDVGGDLKVELNEITRLLMTSDKFMRSWITKWQGFQATLTVSVIFYATPEDVPANFKSGSDFDGYCHQLDTIIGGDLWALIVLLTRKSSPKIVARTDSNGGLILEEGKGNGPRYKMRMPKCICETMFHEMLHMWFQLQYHNRGTGHQAGARTVYDEKGNASYSGFETEFLQKLLEFQNSLDRNDRTECDW